MIDEKQMLDCITESADMGINSLKHVKNQTDNWALTSALEAQIAEYQRDYTEASEMLNNLGHKPKRIGIAPKLFANLTADVKARAAEDRPSAIAEMVIQGSTMGVTEVTKKLNDYTGSDPVIRGLAERHVHTEQANIEAMKRFL